VILINTFINLYKITFMKVSILLLFFVFSISVFGQNVGINQNNPTNSLHVSPFNIGDNPIRIDDLQPYTVGDTALLIINQATGIVKYINNADFINVISNGSGLGTDNQDIDSLVLTGYNLATFIRGGDSSSVDLSPLVDSISNTIINNVDFENQVVSILYDNADTLLYNTDFINNLRDSIDTDIDSLILNNTVLTIYENGTNASVDLSSLSDNDADPTNELQTISKTGSTVTLSNSGGSYTDDDTQLTEAQVDAFANNNGYLTTFTEVDGSVTNEIELPTGGANGQILSTNGSGTYSWISDNAGTDNQNIAGSSFNATTGNLVIGIQNGTNQTVNFNGLKDHDWYEVGGTTAPNSINDNIYTQGRVGIGTPSPSSQTHIRGTTTMPSFPIGITASGNVLRVEQAGGNSIFIDGNAIVTDATTNLSIGTLASTPINFGTNDIIRMTVTGAGAVGIGLGNPSGALHVVGGDSYFTDQPLNNYSSSRSAQSVVTDNLRAASDNGIRLYDGNSNGHLHLGNLGYTYMQSYNTSSIGPGVLGTSSIDLDDNANFANFVINPLGGNIGAGTIAPTEQLHVNGNLKIGLLNSGTTQPAGYGDAIIFSGAPDVSATFDGENSDPISLRRFNVASDQSELRLIIGDNNQVQDAFSIGYGNFAEVFRFETAGAAKKPGGGTWAATSDKRTKKDITNFSDGLNVLTQINPVNFKYNGLYNTTENGVDYVGIIAQDVKKVAPYMIGSYEASKTKDSAIKEEILNYDGGTYMLYILVNSVKEQQEQIEKLKKSNELLMEEVKALKK